MASIITRTFDSYEAFAAYYENRDHRDNVVDIVSNDNAKQPHIDADATFTCKNWQTAVKRLAKATGWDWILAELECSEHFENLRTDCDSVAITQIGDDTWYIAARFYKEAAPAENQPEQKQSPADILGAARKAIENEPARSAWTRGIKLYALELLEDVEAHNLTAEQLADPAAVRAAMLNGAESWEQFSRGGCSLVCDIDIAERLLTPSELRRCDGGERRPNSRKNWLSVQTRALLEASHITARAISAAAHGEVRA